MLFRNVLTYDFTGRGRPRTSRLIEQLAAHRFEPCRPHQAESVGWVAPDGSEDGPLVVELGERQLMCLCVEQRPVPAAIVRRELERRARTFASREGRAPRRRELADWRDAIITDLRPRVFSRMRRQLLLIDANAGLAHTDTVTQSAADRLVEVLRTTLETLPLKLPEPGKPLSRLMTRWVQGGRLPKDLEIGTACVLRDPRDRQRVVRVRGSTELATDVAGQIENGFEVVELELVWADRLLFRLKDDFTVRGLSSVADEDADDEAGSDDAGAEFMASALVETAAVTALALRLRELAT